MFLKNFLFGEIPTTSPSGSFDKNDLIRTGRHLAVVVGGAAATALLNGLVKELGQIDLGKYQIIVTFILASGIVEAVRNYISSHLPTDAQ